MASLIAMLVSVVFLDVILSGDNAVVIAMVANGLPESQRRMAIYAGMALALILRIAFAFLATSLLANPYIGLVGGAALVYIDVKLVTQLVDEDAEDGEFKKEGKTFHGALAQIAIADLSMSLDNILTVAAVAKGHPIVMAIGIMVSILCLTQLANFVSIMLDKHKWIGWIGVALILAVAGNMLYTNLLEVIPHHG